MVVGESFPHDLDDLAFVGFAILNIPDCLDEGGEMIGLEFEGVDEVLEGGGGVLVL